MFRLVAGASFACLFAGKASAAVVLTVDISNLSSVVFSSTGAFAQNDETDTRSLDGIILVGLFSSNPGNGVPDYFSSSNLLAPEASLAFTDFYPGSFSGGPLNLNITGTDQTNQEFSTNAPAFRGSARANFSSVNAGSLVVGKTGDIWAGDAFGDRVVIGQFLIIPEPSTALLGILGMSMMAVRRRR